MAGKVMVIGSTNWDICMYLPRLPDAGETIGDGLLKTNLGGKGANQAVACLRAGAKTEFISCLGDDDTGRLVIDEFERIGLHTTYLSTIKNCSTGTACIFIDAKGENCIGLTAGANAELTEDLVSRFTAQIVDADVLLLQLEIPIATVMAAAELASDANTLVVLNPAPAKELPQQVYKHVDVLTPNRGELAQLTGMAIETEADLIHAARSLIALGVGQVIVTLGSKGALLVNAQSHRLYSPYNVKAKDTTAAGDCFNGYLTAKLANGGLDGLCESIDTAMAAAAIAVTRDGAIPSLPHLSEVNTFTTVGALDSISNN